MVTSEAPRIFHGPSTRTSTDGSWTTRPHGSWCWQHLLQEWEERKWTFHGAAFSPTICSSKTCCPTTQLDNTLGARPSWTGDCAEHPPIWRAKTAHITGPVWKDSGWSKTSRRQICLQQEQQKRKWGADYKAMAANWWALRDFWFARSPWSHKRLIFLPRIVSAPITQHRQVNWIGLMKRFAGMYVHSPREWPMTTLRRRATDAVGQTSNSFTSRRCYQHERRLQSEESIHWWQAVTEHNHAHLQTMAAILGTAPRLGHKRWHQKVSWRTQQTVSQWRSLKTRACLRTLSGMEDFFELWEAKQFSVVSNFDDEDARDSFQRTDFKLMRTSSILQSNTMEHTDGKDDRSLRSGGNRGICLRTAGRRTMRLIFASWKKFIAHQTRNKGGNHGIQSPLRVAVWSRINVSIVAAHSQIVPPRRIM